MCGITVVVTNGDCKYPKTITEAALDGLRHRGPDDKGILAVSKDKINYPEEEELEIINPSVTFFHRRLSIIDLSKAGRQPMSTICNRYHIVFNGEVYNYLELKTELIAKGYQFRSDSDTEVILNSYKEWKEECLNKFIGMFAIIILDTLQSKLFVARDQFGIKPLYYCFWKGGIAFSSEIGPLLTLDGVSKKANPQRVYEYLRFSLTDYGSETLYEDIKQVPPSHWFHVDTKSIKIQNSTKYWSISLNNKSELDYKAAAKKLRNLFLESIELHLRSDVVVGSALSGGIDSSAIVCAIRHLRSDAEIHTFSFIAEDQKISEELWVDLVSKHVGSKTHKVYANQDMLISDIDSLLITQGEPFASTSIYAQNQVFKTASQMGIKVMLDGQGADEILAGYSRYQGARFGSLLKSGNIFSASSFIKHSSNWPGRSKSEIFKRGVRHLLPPFLLPFAMKVVGHRVDSEWLNMNWFHNQNVNYKIPGRNDCIKYCLKENLVNDIENVSLPHLLRFEDRNSMTYSVESRVPFLTTKIVEFIFSLPEYYLIDDSGTSKAIFREAMRGIVPDKILDRKDKIGFQTPELSWLRKIQPWIEETLNHSSKLPVFNEAKLVDEWENILSGKRPFDFRLWRWIDYSKWSELNGIQYK